MLPSTSCLAQPNCSYVAPQHPTVGMAPQGSFQGRQGVNTGHPGEGQGNPWEMCPSPASRGVTHLLCVLLLDRLQVGPEIHGHLVLGAQQSPEHGIGRDADPAQGRALELPSEIKNFDFQIFNLPGQERRRRGRSLLGCLAQRAPVGSSRLCQHQGLCTSPAGPTPPRLCPPRLRAGPTLLMWQLYHGKLSEPHG